MKWTATILLYVLLFVFAPVYAQTNDENAGKTKLLLQQCDSLKNNTGLGTKGRGIKLRRVAFEGLHSIQKNDFANGAQFNYYVAYGYVFEDSINVDSVRYFFTKSLDAARKTAFAPLIVNAASSLMHIGFEMQDSKETDTYKSIIQSVVDTTKDNIALQNGYAALGTYYQQKSYYSTAQDYFFKSLQLEHKQTSAAWTAKDKTDFANRCYTLAQLYVKTATFDKAFSALNLGRLFTGSDYLIDTRYKILLIDLFAKTNNIDSALYYLHTYMDPVADKFKNNRLIPDRVIMPNLAVGRYFLDHKNYPLAWQYLQKINLFPADKIDHHQLYQIQKTTGRYYELTGAFSKAIPLFKQALPLAKAFSKEDYTDILQYLAEAQQGAGNLPAALQYYKAYNQTLDSLTKEKLSRNFADQQTRYETEQKQQQIVVLDKENKLNVLQLQNAARTKWFLVLGLIALSVIALLFYFIYRNREKLNRQLNIQKAELQILNSQLSVANDTKAKLFGIISHDLRAPISKVVQLMQLQKEHPQMLDAQTAQKHEKGIQQATEMVLETMEDLLLWSKSQMQQFKADKTLVNLHEVVVKECDFLQSAADEKKIAINNNLPQRFVQTTDENFIAVIIRNLLQNAIKYADANTAIFITAKENSLQIINTTSGTTAEELIHQFSQKQINSKASGLGLQIVNDLVAQLHHQVFFEQQNNGRIAAIIRFAQ